MFACQHFESYIYGRDVVHIETDHQPLVSIVLKPLNSAPSRLQRMLLKLQKFNLKLTYKNGKSMYLADTISRAYLPEVHTCAREMMFWPRMSSELKEYVSKCDVCLADCSTQGKEPIVQHEFPARPWAKVGADLCDFQGRTLLVVCDYYSNFIEVESITQANTSGICKVLKTLFARYGVPDSLMSDNGPQFASAEFASFARKWGFEHVTSSPHYPQSNGKAENAVKTVKRLFSVCLLLLLSHMSPHRGYN